VPPVEHRFKPGNRAAANRDTSGAIIKNYINGFGRRNLRTGTLKAIANDKRKPHLMRLAANRMLSAMHDGADFDRLINYTDGKPKQKQAVFLKTPVDRAAAAVAATERLRKILRPSGN
jgi:hypothetical protein